MKTLKQFLTLETTVKIIMVTFITFTLICALVQIISNPERISFGSF